MAAAGLNGRARAPIDDEIVAAFGIDEGVCADIGDGIGEKVGDNGRARRRIVDADVAEQFGGACRAVYRDDRVAVAIFDAQGAASDIEDDVVAVDGIGCRARRNFDRIAVGVIGNDIIAARVAIHIRAVDGIVAVAAFDGNIRAGIGNEIVAVACRDRDAVGAVGDRVAEFGRLDGNARRIIDDVRRAVVLRRDVAFIVDDGKFFALAVLEGETAVADIENDIIAAQLRVGDGGGEFDGIGRSAADDEIVAADVRKEVAAFVAEVDGIVAGSGSDRNFTRAADEFVAEFGAFERNARRGAGKIERAVILRGDVAVFVDDGDLLHRAVLDAQGAVFEIEDEIVADDGCTSDRA